MRSSYKVLKINSLCYRDRFVKQFPLFLTELKDLGLYDDFVAGKASEHYLPEARNYDSNFDTNLIVYDKDNKKQTVHIQKYLMQNKAINIAYTLFEKNKIKTIRAPKTKVSRNFSVNTDYLLSNLFKSSKKKINQNLKSSRAFDIKKENIIKEKQVLPETTVKGVHVHAKDLIIKDKFFEEERENFLREFGLEDYSKIKYDTSQEYTFHDTDATIFARKQRKEEKKERKKQRALRKQEKMEQEKKKIDAATIKPKNPSFYDLLNIPLELRIAKYDIPLPSEEEEEEVVIEHTPIDWEAEDLKYLVIVPHIRNIKFFDGAVGFSFGMYTGNKLLPVAVTESRVGSFLGSFIFTKRITREIHAKKNKKSGKRK